MPSIPVGDNIFFLLIADIISCVEYNDDGELLATGDKGGRVVIFQRDQSVSFLPVEYSRIVAIFRPLHHGLNLSDFMHGPIRQDFPLRALTCRSCFHALREHNRKISQWFTNLPWRLY